MRTMLISLFLIGTLINWASAQSPGEGPIRRGCGETFQCFVPDYCTNTAADKKLSTSTVMMIVNKNIKITNDCPAIFRFHGYNKYWQHISLESLLPATQSISFVYESPSHAFVKGNLSCSKVIRTSGEWEITAGYEGKGTDAEKIVMIGKIDMKEKIGDANIPLKCSFEIKVKAKDGHEILRETLNSVDLAHFVIDTATTNVNGRQMSKIDTLYCDPGRFNFESKLNEERNEVYKKVEFEPGKYICKSNDEGIQYRMQYREFGTEKYRNVNELKCGDEQDFQVQFDAGEAFKPVDEFGKLDIRCVADANYFCNYPAHSTKPTEQRLKLEPKKGNINQVTEMKCPDGFPFFHLFGQPVRNPQFKCQNYGLEPFWTIGGQLLAQQGPDVYCTKEVDCYKIPDSAISESAVNGGFVGTDGLPQCYGGGELHWDSHSPANEVKEKLCDKSVGKYKYKLKYGESKEIDNTTKFMCYYKPIVDETAKKQASQDFLTTGLITTAASIGGVIVVIIICAAVYLYRLNLRRKKARKAEAAAWVTYCMDAKELEAYYAKNTQLKPKREDESMSAPGESWNWNVMLTSMQYEAWAAIAPDATGVAKIIPANDMLPTRDRFDPNDKNYEKCIAIVDIPDEDGQYNWRKTEENKFLKKEFRIKLWNRSSFELDDNENALKTKNWEFRIPKKKEDEEDALM